MLRPHIGLKGVSEASKKSPKKAFAVISPNEVIISAGIKGRKKSVRKTREGRKKVALAQYRITSVFAGI